MAKAEIVWKKMYMPPLESKVEETLLDPLYLNIFWFFFTSLGQKEKYSCLRKRG